MESQQLVGMVMETLTPYFGTETPKELAASLIANLCVRLMYIL